MKFGFIQAVMSFLLVNYYKSHFINSIENFCLLLHLLNFQFSVGFSFLSYIFTDVKTTLAAPFEFFATNFIAYPMQNLFMLVEARYINKVHLGDPCSPVTTNIVFSLFSVCLFSCEHGCSNLGKVRSRLLINLRNQSQMISHLHQQFATG